MRIEYCRPRARGHLVLGAPWRVQPADELIKRLRQLLGQNGVRVSYERPVGEGVAGIDTGARPRLVLVK